MINEDLMYNTFRKELLIAQMKLASTLYIDALVQIMENSKNPNMPRYLDSPDSAVQAVKSVVEKGLDMIAEQFQEAVNFADPICRKKYEDRFK